MMTEHERLNDHEKFKELGVLANSGSLTTNEWAELRAHLEICQACREVRRQYLILARDGMPLLAARCSDQKERGNWDDTLTRRQVFARIRAQVEQAASGPSGGQLKVLEQPNNTWRISAKPLARTVLAACLVGAITLVAYRLGGRAQTDVKPAQVSFEDRLQKLLADKKKAVDESNESLDIETEKLLKLQQKYSQKEQELTKLQSALLTVEDRRSELAVANSETNKRLQTVSLERDAVLGQLQDTQQEYQKIQSELASLRYEYDKTRLQSASLESRIVELSAAAGDQERRIRDDEQFLASDRDIRELIGARKLYIADVFDVDSRSRTRKSFGRVFYTQGKSLIFYAFDLDDQADLKNASAFQVWGRKVTDDAKPLSLGIFYMDSESNRRWVLRFDDPKQLAEIDAVFVTVEPHGGSGRPTGKPFLSALLRKEANHP
jgi:hypothetical protein